MAYIEWTIRSSLLHCLRSATWVANHTGLGMALIAESNGVHASYIVSDEFVDLSVEDEPQNAKTARSTAGKER